MNQCQHGNDPEDCPSCNRQPTDAPTPEALRAAVDFLWPHYTDDKLPKEKFAQSEQRCQNLAHALDTFAKAAVERERERWLSNMQTCEATVAVSGRYNADEKAAVSHCLKVLRDAQP